MKQDDHINKFETKSFQDLDKKIFIEDYTDFLNFIRWAMTVKDKIFFRGQSDESWDLVSTWVRNAEEEEIRQKLQKQFKDRVKRIISKPDFRDKNALEILASLRHSGVESPLIDLSSNVLIALWFATGNLKYNFNNPNIRPKLFIVSHTEKPFLDIQNWDNLNGVFSSPKIINRSIAQNSYFIFDNEYWQNELNKQSKDSNIKTVIIDCSIIESINDYLWDRNVSNCSIFPDLEGTFLDQDSYSPEGYFRLANNTADKYFHLVNNKINFSEDQKKPFNEKGEKNKIREIIALYDKAIAKDPDLIDAYFNKSFLHTFLGEIEEGIATVDRAIEIKPNQAEPYLNKGKVMHSLGKYKEAISMYDKAIEINPKLDETYVDKGNALRLLDKNEEAIYMYDKAIEINPISIQAFSDKAIALMSMLKYENAIAMYNKILVINPYEYMTYFKKGIALYCLNEHLKANAEFDRSIEIKPNFVAAYIGKSNVFSMLNKCEEAITMCDKVIEINPDYSHAYFHKGDVLCSLNKHKQAIEVFDKAIKINPSLINAYIKKSNALITLGKKQEAYETLNKVLTLDPNNKDAISMKENIRAIITR